MRRTGTTNTGASKPPRVVTPRGRRLVIALLIGACTACAAAAFAAQAYMRSAQAEAGSSITLEAEPLAGASLLQSGPPPERLDIEVITVLPHGFEPTEIARPSGPFGIAVENRSGLSDVQLRLDREGSTRLYEAQVTRQRLNWKQGVDLPPGRYVLTEAGHPEWVCLITINQK